MKTNKIISPSEAIKITHSLAADKDIPCADNRKSCDLRREYAIGLLLTKHSVAATDIGRFTVVFEDSTPYHPHENLLSKDTNAQGWTDWLKKTDDAARWRYHTALTLDVKDAAGIKTTLVIDPSTDPLKPMTIKDFIQRASIHSQTGHICVYHYKLGNDIKPSDFTVYDPQAWQGPSAERNAQKKQYAEMGIENSAECFKQRVIARATQKLSTGSMINSYGDVAPCDDWTKQWSFQKNKQIQLLKDILHKGHEFRHKGNDELLGQGFVSRYEKMADEANTVQI